MRRRAAPPPCLLRSTSSRSSPSRLAPPPAATCSKELYDGKCRAFTQEAKGKWDDWITPDGCVSDVCCASNEDDCCEANVGAIVGLVVAIVVVVAMCCYMFAGESILAYCQNDETVAIPPDSIKLENCRRIHAPMRDWYAAPAQRSLRAKHGNFPRDPEVLSAWSSYDAARRSSTPPQGERTTPSNQGEYRLTKEGTRRLAIQVQVPSTSSNTLLAMRSTR